MANSWDPPTWDQITRHQEEPPSQNVNQAGTGEDERLKAEREFYSLLYSLGGGGNSMSYGSGYGGYGGLQPGGGSYGGSSTGSSLGGVIGLFSDINNMVNVKAEHNKYANTILSQNMDLPSGIREGEQELTKLASQGLPGYEVLKQRTMNTVPQLMSQFEQLGSPNQVLGELGKAGGRAAYQMDSLGIRNEEAKLRNNLALINFLGMVKAPAQQRINEFDINKRLAAAQERMLGEKEQNQAFENTTSSLISLFGSMAM